MKLVEGVNLHLIKNKKFKTNQITFRFSGDFNQKTVAKRVLIAQILATANAKYPTAQKFRERLADLYGASLLTRLSTKGLVHILDIEVTFVKDEFVITGEAILEEIITFLYDLLFSPLISVEQYQSKLFLMEQSNLINYLKTDQDDSFYSSDLALKKIFYKDTTLQLSKYGSVNLVEVENSYTTFQEFQKMIQEDQLDIFILGEFDEYRMIQLFNKYPLEKRQKNLNFDYQQPYVNITQEKLEKKDISQSILQLGYHLPVKFQDDDYFDLLVFNGMFGAFAHSKLFMEIRENKGLSYSIGSHFDIFTGLLSVYAGIDKQNRNQTMQLINRQFSDIKMGRFSGNLLKQTKDMLKTNMIFASDAPRVIIEQEYNKHHLKNHYNLKDVLDKIDKVTKTDVVKVATKIKLQSLYFLEGK